MTRRVALLAAACSLGACNLTLTREPLDYESLDTVQRAAVDRIFARLQAYDARLRSASGGEHVLGPLAEDHDRIDVSLEGLWVMTNIGDDRVHVTVWEKLSDVQRGRFAGWFGETAAAAAARYGRFFYEYVAVHLAGVQTVYVVQGVDYVYTRRHVFNVERDAERMAVTFLTETDRALFDAARATCNVIRAEFDDRWGEHYDRRYYGEHLRELTDPGDPSGYLYFLCRHLEEAEWRRVTFSSSFRAELDILGEYPDLDGEL